LKNGQYLLFSILIITINLILPEQFSNFLIEPASKSRFTPISPEGDFCKMLVFNAYPSGAGVKKD